MVMHPPAMLADILPYEMVPVTVVLIVVIRWDAHKGNFECRIINYELNPIKRSYWSDFFIGEMLAIYLSQRRKEYYLVSYKSSLDGIKNLDFYIYDRLNKNFSAS